MVIKKLLEYGISELKSSNSATPQLDAAVLLCCLLDCDRVYLIVNAQKNIDAETEKAYKTMIEKRKNDMPVAYITHKQEFMSLDFYVDKNVLIPRPDTEILVEHIINSDFKKETILDMCCGSGCIGISLAYYLKESEVHMADISKNALEITKKNADRYKISNYKLIKLDILNDTPKQKYDIIVSNPPYIESETIKKLDRNVVEFEPIIALDGGESGLVFYERICKIAPSFLNKNGILAFEIGDNQGKAVSDLFFKNNFTDIQIIKDLSAHDRVVSGKLK